MSWHIVEQPLSQFTEHASVPISFQVISRLDVSAIESGLSGLAMREQIVERPYIKDYDDDAEEGPEHWCERWDLSKWVILAAFYGEKRVGGAVLAFDTDNLDMLEGRKDLMVLWDLRVHPEHRRQGVGGRLFRASEDWALARSCLQIKVETQNINVAACRFYANQGCVLRASHRFAYPKFPDEVQLLWYKDLTTTDKGRIR